MKKVIFFALTTLAIATLPSFKPPPAEVIDWHLELDIPATLVLCDGGIVDLTVHEDLDFHIVFNNNRANVSTHSRRQYTGIDANGNVYHGTGFYNEHENIPLHNDAFSYVIVYKENFIGQGSAPNFSAYFTIKFIVNANGEVSIDRFESDTSCD